jgi:hypothetical protein
MKEVTRKTMVELNLEDSVTGEFTRVSGERVETEKYYSIKKITARINGMDLFTVMEKTCTSSKDIHIFNMLTDMSDNEGNIVIGNITRMAKELGVSRVKLSVFLKKLIDIEFLKKTNNGEYAVNPFIFIGRRVRSNEDREKLQLKWHSIEETE